MKKFRSTVLLATAAALVAVPATAGAAPSVKDVRLAAKEARVALSGAADAARAGHPRQLRAAVAGLGKDVRRAERKARKLKRKAGSRRERARAARALTVAAASYDNVVGEFAGLLDEVPASVQPLIAQALALGADAQDRIVTVLTKLAGRLPDPAAQAVLAAIEQFQTDGDLEALVAALSSDEVTDSVKGLLSEHLDVMFGNLSSLVDRLAEIDPELAGMVGGILDSLHGLIGQVNDMLSHLFDGLLGGGIPLFPGFDGLPGFGELFSGLSGFGSGGDGEGSGSWPGFGWGIFGQK